MARRFVVVPYDWVKNLIRHPPELQKKLDENEMTRAFNLRFPDDFGKPTDDSGKVKQDQEQKEEPKAEREQKPPTVEDVSEAFHEAQEPPNFTGEWANLKNELFKVAGLTLDGKVVDNKGNIIKTSNIDDIISYLQGQRNRRPVAVSHVISLIKNFNIEHKGLQIGRGEQRQAIPFSTLNKWIKI
jgi:hypothetical protein